MLYYQDKIMDIHEVCLVTFSPTHTSKQVGDAIVRGIGCSKVTNIDLTLCAIERCEIPQGALTIISVPVYGGHVAPLALERMKEIHADGSPAVLVVVYGNRAYEKALIDLDTFASGLGFKVIAGATFVGEHSYSSEKYPVAIGRPDAEDLEFAELFGQKILAKVTNAADMEKLYGVDVTRIQRPRQPFFPLFRFMRKILKLRKSGVPFPRTPKTDADLCTHCGICVKNCPTGAILKGDECNTITEKCIKCCACVKECPQKARTYDTPYAPLLAEHFKRQKEDRIII